MLLHMHIVQYVCMHHVFTRCHSAAGKASLIARHSVSRQTWAGTLTLGVMTCQCSHVPRSTHTRAEQLGLQG